MTSTESHQSEFDPATINMPSCQKCGAYYATWEDLFRHQNKSCPESSCEKGKVKKERSPEKEQDLWFQLDAVKNVMQEMRDEYNERVAEMMEQEGFSKKKAEKEAHNELLPRLRKGYRQALANYLIQMHKVQETDMYHKLMQTAQHLMDEEDSSLEEAIPRALKQRKYIFDQLVKEESDSSESEEEREDTEEEGGESDS